MKKLVLTFAVLLSVGLSTAVVGGPNPGEDQMAITTAGGSASATTGVGPNGTDYTSYFSVTNATQANETGVTNSSFEGDTAQFTGVYRTPTPCYELNHDLEKNGNTYNFDITSEETGNGTCAQVVTYYEYEANFTADQAYRLNVSHDGVEQEVFEHPDLEDGNRGFFAQLLGGLISLFLG